MRRGTRRTTPRWRGPAWIRSGTTRSSAPPQGWDPGPRFSTEFYLEHNPDVSRGTNALLHYLRHGRARGSKIAPSTVERQWLTLTLDERFPNLRPLHVYASASAPKRISMVTDSINSGSLFGGVGTALIFATLLARRMRTAAAHHHPLGAADPGQLPDRARGQWDSVARRCRLCLLVARHVERTARRCRRRRSLRHHVVVDDLGDPRIGRSREHHLSRPGGRAALLPGGRRFDSLRGDPRRPANHVRRQLQATLRLSLRRPGYARSRAVVVRPGVPGVPDSARGVRTGKRNFIFYARPKNLRNLYYRGLEAIAGAIETRPPRSRGVGLLLHRQGSGTGRRCPAASARRSSRTSAGTTTSDCSGAWISGCR